MKKRHAPHLTPEQNARIEALKTSQHERPEIVGVLERIQREILLGRETIILRTGTLSLQLQDGNQTKPMHEILQDLGLNDKVQESTQRPRIGHTITLVRKRAEATVSSPRAHRHNDIGLITECAKPLTDQSKMLKEITKGREDALQQFLQDLHGDETDIPKIEAALDTFCDRSIAANHETFTKFCEALAEHVHRKQWYYHIAAYAQIFFDMEISDQGTGQLDSDWTYIPASSIRGKLYHYREMILRSFMHALLKEEFLDPFCEYFITQFDLFLYGQEVNHSLESGITYSEYMLGDIRNHLAIVMAIFRHLKNMLQIAMSACYFQNAPGMIQKLDLPLAHVRWILNLLNQYRSTSEDESDAPRTAQERKNQQCIAIYRGFRECKTFDRQKNLAELANYAKHPAKSFFDGPVQEIKQEENRVNEMTRKFTEPLTAHWAAFTEALQRHAQVLTTTRLRTITPGVSDWVQIHVPGIDTIVKAVYFVQTGRNPPDFAVILEMDMIGQLKRHIVEVHFDGINYQMDMGAHLLSVPGLTGPQTKIFTQAVIVKALEDILCSPHQDASQKGRDTNGTGPRIFSVRGHIRRLPGGKQASSQALEAATRDQVMVPPGYTYISPYQKSPGLRPITGGHPIVGGLSPQQPSGILNAEQFLASFGLPTQSPSAS